MEDMRMTGKRNPYSSDYKIGLDKDLKVIAYEVDFYQNAGAAADLSPAVLERTLFHCTNSYFIPNVRATAYSCRTNLPPNTAFRGFGGPQGMFVIESAIAHAAHELNVSPLLIQEKNLIDTGDVFPYGQKAVSDARTCWNEAAEKYGIQRMLKEVDDFNEKNFLYKKGLAAMPICFGISFTKTVMNQARSLVHIYTDGSIAVSTGAVEMGQGVNTKIVQVAADTFSVNPSRIRINTTSTARIANTSPSAASATADLNGRATQMACNILLERLKKRAAEELNAEYESVMLQDEFVYVNGIKSDLDWQKLVMITYLRRISLSEHAHYATPEIFYDAAIEKGHPFAYHVYGTAFITVTLDCLRGTYEVDSVKVVHDSGSGKSEIIDRGQCEGGIVQGIGWMTMEEIVYDENGKLRSNALSTYKVPDVYSVPKVIEICFLKNQNENLALQHSKAVGEPPLMYGIGVYFALQNAINKFNGQSVLRFDSPMTPEKVLMVLYRRKQVQEKV
jgi:xanthine dehydrogenase large subunit